MSAPLAFCDVETTGLHPDLRLAWEVAIIRREPDGEETQALINITDVNLAFSEPKALEVGRFYERHIELPPKGNGPNGQMLMPEKDAALVIDQMTRGAHLVGAVVSFDAETLADLLRRHGRTPAWHYHLIDIKPLMLGYLAGAGSTHYPPWRSGDLASACGVERDASTMHTALGDAEWAMRVFDTIMGA
jgi:hypothetical protein